MRWIVHGERSLYESPWVNLALVDVEVPGGPRFDHHAVRFPREAAGAVVRDAERGLLLLWRHRFITGVAADGADERGAPEDWAEVERVEWVPIDRVREEARGGRIRDGFSLTALLWFLLMEL